MCGWMTITREAPSDKCQRDFQLDKPNWLATAAELVKSAMEANISKHSTPTGHQDEDWYGALKQQYGKNFELTVLSLICQFAYQYIFGKWGWWKTM